MRILARPAAAAELPHADAGAVRSVVAQALALAVASRVVLVGIVWLSLRALPRLGLYPVQLPDSFFPSHPLLAGWARWDAAHYVAIAQVGYGGANPSPHGGLGFFPLYPLLMRGAVTVTGLAPTPGHLAFAGIVIANACFLGVVPMLTRLAAARYGPDAARNAALLLCITPFGFFFDAAYTESLFLLLVLASLALGLRGRWWLAGLLAALASGTRLVGLALLPALLLMAYRRRTGRRDLAALCVLAPLGMLAYFAYTAWAFGDPFAYFHAQATWGGWNDHVLFYTKLFLFHPWKALASDPGHLIIMLDVALGLVYLAFLPQVWRDLDPGIALFTALLVVLQGAMTWVSLGRYVLPAFGVYLAAGAVLTRPRWAGWARDAILICSSLLLATLAILYAHGFWVV